MKFALLISVHALLFSDTSPKLTPKNRRRESSFLGGFFWPWEHPSTVLPKAEDVLSPEGRQLGCAKASAAPVAALTRAGSAVFSSVYREGFFPN